MFVVTNLANKENAQFFQSHGQEECEVCRQKKFLSASTELVPFLKSNNMLERGLSNNKNRNMRIYMFSELHQQMKKVTSTVCNLSLYATLKN